MIQPCFASAIRAQPRHVAILKSVQLYPLQTFAKVLYLGLGMLWTQSANVWVQQIGEQQPDGKRVDPCTSEHICDYKFVDFYSKSFCNNPMETFSVPQAEAQARR